jgi:hypothetical protein
MVPTICRVVTYTLDAYDADAITRRRAAANTNLADHRARMDGSQLHIGNGVRAGDAFPMIIVRVWGSEPTSAVNGQVLLDGCDTHWVTSVTVGEGPRHFAWPARV